MASKLQLEVFDLPQNRGDRTRMSAAELEETRLASFEKGYSAGWDDAVAAQVNEAAKMRADLARNLQDLSFTYHEARAHILQSMEPLLRDIVAKVLPATARMGLAQTVHDLLMPMATGLSETPFTVVVNPKNRAAVEKLLAETKTLHFSCVEEPSMGMGQAYLRHGHSETRLDMDAVITKIGEAITDFYITQNEEQNGG